MRARDLAEDLPTVGPDDDAMQAAQLIAGERLPAIAVLDDGRYPVAVLRATEVLRFVIPGYVQEDPSLARVLDEASADTCASELDGKRVRDILPGPDRRVELAVVECAAEMARLNSPLLVVVDDGQLCGLLTVSHLLEVLLPLPDSPAGHRPGPGQGS